MASTAVRPAEPASATLYIHRSSHLSYELVIYGSDQTTIAYTVTTPHGLQNPFSNSPNLHIYRGSSALNPSTTDSDGGGQLITTSRLPKVGSLSLQINDRSVDSIHRVRGFYKYAREWTSPSGLMRWEHHRFSVRMELVDGRGEVLGRWESDRGKERRIARLWLRDVEGQGDQQWVDEVVSVAVAVTVMQRRMG